MLSRPPARREDMISYLDRHLTATSVSSDRRTARRTVDDAPWPNMRQCGESARSYSEWMDRWGLASVSRTEEDSSALRYSDRPRRLPGLLLGCWWCCFLSGRRPPRLVLVAAERRDLVGRILAGLCGWEGGWADAEFVRYPCSI